MASAAAFSVSNMPRHLRSARLSRLLVCGFAAVLFGYVSYCPSIIIGTTCVATATGNTSVCAGLGIAKHMARLAVVLQPWRRICRTSSVVTAVAKVKSGMSPTAPRPCARLAVQQPGLFVHWHNMFASNSDLIRQLVVGQSSKQMTGQLRIDVCNSGNICTCSAGSGWQVSPCTSTPQHCYLVKLSSGQNSKSAEST
jgi:hypothetical protein